MKLLLTNKDNIYLSKMKCMEAALVGALVRKKMTKKVVKRQEVRG